MNTKLINEFVKDDHIAGVYMLVKCNGRRTNGGAGKHYLDVELSDMTGKISCKYWDTSEAMERVFERLPMVVSVNGQVGIYQERNQLTIKDMQVYTGDEYSLSDFFRSAPMSPATCKEVILERVERMSSPVLIKVVTYVLGKVWEEIDYAPAAKDVHHAYATGLLYHKVRMLGISAPLCVQRPYLNSDLLDAGIITHDIAKPRELIHDKGVVTDYSTPGKLLGHISLAYEWVAEAAWKEGLSDHPEVLALKHLILSHHGKPEWGSPVYPQLPEALALHHIDNLDAKLQAAEDIMASTAQGQWTERMLAFDYKALYKM